MNVRRMGALALGAAATVAVTMAAGASGAAGEASASAVRTITVTGSGAALSTPNRAAFSFGVTTQAKTATAALNGNNAEMRKVIDAVKKAGVAAKDVQTSSVSLSPRYSNDGENIIGYIAQNTVNATIRGVTRSGAVIDAAVGAGANQVYGPAFTRSDETVLYRRALAAAVANARGKAQTLAGAAKVRLGAVRSIVESSAGPVPIAEKAAAAPDTPIEPGAQRIEANVTVEFGLR
ncbi:MAG TPA: SIMPL domain-containing protein [Gaiellaceae bacterium]|nr:SIMPL domain-containing protein [Gaiellaceae bacterium]